MADGNDEHRDQGASDEGSVPAWAAAADAFLQARDLAEKRAVLEGSAEQLLTDEAIAGFEEAAAAHEDAGFAAFVREHAALLGECRTHGIATVFDAIAAAQENDAGDGSGEETVEPPESQAGTAGASPSLSDRLITVLNARSWTDTRDLLEADAELLGDAALEILGQMLRHYGEEDNEGAIAALEEHRALFLRCREVGIVAAFEEKLGAPMDLQTALQRIMDLQGDPQRAAEVVQLCNQLLGVLDRWNPEAAGPWAQLQGTRANALLRLGELRGDAALLRQAVDAYDLALEVMTRAVMPAEWATTQMNRASALARLGNLAGDALVLRQAVEGYDLALDVLTRAAMPADWATTQMNRANALRSLGELAGDASVLRQAVGGYDLALEVQTRAAMPSAWAMTQMNRANALLSLGNLAGDASVLRQAVEGYDLALQVRTRAAMPADWAMTQMNRANALQSLGALQGDAAVLAAAEAGYRQVLETARPDGHLTLFLTAARVLARLLQRRSDWSGAVALLDDVLPAVRRVLSGGMLSRRGRDEAIARTSGLHDLRAWAGLELGQDPGAMLVLLEQGRARALALALMPDVDDVSGIDPAEREMLDQLADGIRSIQARLGFAPAGAGDPMATGSGPGATAAASIRSHGALTVEARTALHADLERLYDERRRRLAELGLLQEPAERTVAELLAAVPDDGALVVPLTGSTGTRVFVVPGCRTEVTAGDILELPELDETGFHAWYFRPGADKDAAADTGAGTDGAGTDGAGADGATTEGDAPGGTAGLAYLEGYNRFHEEIGAARGTAGTDILSNWSRVIVQTVGRAWSELLEPVHHRLEALGLAEGAPVVLMPGGLLGLLPLHLAGPRSSGEPEGSGVEAPATGSASEAPGAADTADGDAALLAGGDDTWCWGDHWSLSVVPSLHALEASTDRVAAWEQAGSPVKVLGVLDPESEGQNRLTGSRSEAALLRRRFPEMVDDDCLVGRAATYTAVLGKLSGASVLHYSGHGIHLPQTPEKSGLVLAGKDQLLTVEVLMSNAVSLAGHRLTLLSACGSMLSGVGRAAEEFVGLPTGWLQAGSPAVIASLWPVRDDATLLLMQRFHELWTPGDTGRYPSPASATVVEGIILLAIYSAGLGVPFLVAAVFTEKLAGRLRAVGRVGRRLHQGAGLVVVIVGVAMMSGYLSAFAFWLLGTFPVLGQIG